MQIIGFIVNTDKYKWHWWIMEPRRYVIFYYVDKTTKVKLMNIHFSPVQVIINEKWGYAVMMHGFGCFWIFLMYNTKI